MSKFHRNSMKSDHVCMVHIQPKLYSYLTNVNPSRVLLKVKTNAERVGLSKILMEGKKQAPLLVVPFCQLY